MSARLTKGSAPIDQRCPSPSGASHGPRSLWEMMDKYGLKLAKAMIELGEAKWFCMPLRMAEGETGQWPLPWNAIEKAVALALRTTREACILSDMENVLPELDRLHDIVWPATPRVPHAPPHAVAQAINHLTCRLKDELDQQWFFHLTQKDVQFYGQKTLFGEAVSKKFKKAVDDIERAGNCLALQQPTACIFHLMRAMEVAVRDLAKRLSITITPQSTWRQMTGAMDPKIRAMPEVTERQKDKKNEWESTRANLHHVGSVWRNNTMHPATSYTQAQALDVLNAVRVFMSCLTAL